MGRNNKEQEEEENNNNKSKDVYIETKKSEPQQKVVFSLFVFAHTRTYAHIRTFTLIHSLTHSLHSLTPFTLLNYQEINKKREREREKKNE